MRFIILPALAALALAGCDGMSEDRTTGDEISQADQAKTGLSGPEQLNAVRAAIIARNFGEAATLARAAVTNNPEDPEVQLLLARAEALLGNSGNALHALERAVTAGIAKPAEAILDSAFDSLRNDSRFAAIEALVQPAAKVDAPMPPKRQSAPVSERPEVEIGTRNGKDYIRAGDIVIDGNF